MTLTILDPCTGNRVTVEVPVKPQPKRRARRSVLCALDRLHANKEPDVNRA
jgi:hypothetical protein